MSFGIEKFELKKEHIMLIERFNIGWENCEFGAPCIDPKRPFGNSNVIGDIAEILNIDSDEEGEFTREQEDYMCKLYEETETALSIILRTKSFETGIYISDKYMDNWRKEDNNG